LPVKCGRRNEALVISRRHERWWLVVKFSSQALTASFDLRRVYIGIAVLIKMPLPGKMKA